MNGKGWRLSFSVILLILLAALFVKWLEPGEPAVETVADGVVGPASTDVRVYFPPLQGMTYRYSGEGMEYAAFTRRITFTSPDFIQMEDLSGTNLAQVVKYDPKEIGIIWSEEEFYARESLLDTVTRENRGTGVKQNLILLQAPIVTGHSWSDERFQREIIATDEIVTVPLGTFYEVVTVKSKSVAQDDFVIYEYYAKNIGLIKRVSLYEQDEEAYAVVSELKSLACPPPQL